MMIKISAQRIPTKKNRIFSFIIHYILIICFYFSRLLNLKFLNKQKQLLPENIRRILVIRIDGLGDVVMSTPVFNALREIFPHSYATLLAASWSKDLVELMPSFDAIIYFDAPWIVKGNKWKLMRLFRTIRKLRTEKFDLAIDLRGDFRNNILMFFLNAKYRLGFNITGCDFLLTHVIPCNNNHHPVHMMSSLINYLKPHVTENYNLQLWTSKQDETFAEEFMVQNGIKKDDITVIIHPASRWNGRQWTIEGYSKIADRLIDEYKAKVIFAGSTEEAEITEGIVALMNNQPIIAIGKITLRQYIALLVRSGLFIGSDSGPMHMAAAVGTRVVALFGAARPEAVGPYGSNHIVVTKQDAFSCSPCAQTVCKRPDDSCMKAIGVDDVWNAVKKQITRILAEKDRTTCENTIN